MPLPPTFASDTTEVLKAYGHFFGIPGKVRVFNSFTVDFEVWSPPSYGWDRTRNPAYAILRQLNLAKLNDLIESRKPDDCIVDVGYSREAIVGHAAAIVSSHEFVAFCDRGRSWDEPHTIEFFEWPEAATTETKRAWLARLGRNLVNKEDYVRELSTIKSYWRSTARSRQLEALFQKSRQKGSFCMVSNALAAVQTLDWLRATRSVMSREPTEGPASLVLDRGLQVDLHRALAVNRRFFGSVKTAARRLIIARMRGVRFEGKVEPTPRYTARIQHLDTTRDARRFRPIEQGEKPLLAYLEQLAEITQSAKVRRPVLAADLEAASPASVVFEHGSTYLSDASDLT